MQLFGEIALGGFGPLVSGDADAATIMIDYPETKPDRAVAPNTLRPTRGCAREMGRRGERGADAWLIEGNAGVRAPPLQGGSPGTADGEAISSLSFFPGSARATGAATMQPPARTIGARRQRPSLSRGDAIVADGTTAGIGPVRVNRDAGRVRRVARQS